METCGEDNSKGVIINWVLCPIVMAMAMTKFLLPLPQLSVNESLHGYTFTNNHHIGLKVILLESELFTSFRLIKNCIFDEGLEVLLQHMICNTPKLKDRGMCDKFALTEKSRVKNWMGIW